MSSTDCPKCGSAMVEGHIVYKVLTAPTLLHWHEGAPEQSPYLGELVGGGPQFTIKTYRCSGCGFLESYASPVD